MTNFVSLAGLCIIMRGWTGFPVSKVNWIIFSGPALAFLERRLLWIKSEAKSPVNPARAISIWKVERLSFIPSTM